MYNDIGAFLYSLVLAIWGLWEVQLIVIHVLVNFVAAVSVALAIGTFRLDRLVDVLLRKLLPLVMIYSVVKFAAFVLASAPEAAGFSAFVQSVMVVIPYFVLFAIEVLLLSDLANNLVLVPGLEGILDALPEPIFNMIVKESTKETLARRNSEAT
jgi:hypothetical protein